jgi:tetratricopeptide (TPR) repeat protein
LTNKEAPDATRFEALGRLEGSYATTKSATAGIAFFKQYMADAPSTAIVPDVYRIMGHLANVMKDKNDEDEFYRKCFEAFQRMYDNASGAQEKVVVLMRYAYAHHFKGDLDPAVSLLQKGLKDFPTAANRLDLYYELADLYFRNQKFDKAVETCRQIPLEFPNDQRRIRSYFTIADCHLYQKKYDDAVKDLQEIIALFPSTEYAYRANQAIRYTEAMRRKEAETSATLAASKVTSGTATLPGAIGVTTLPAPVRMFPPKSATTLTVPVTRPPAPQTPGSASPTLPRR